MRKSPRSRKTVTELANAREKVISSYLDLDKEDSDKKADLLQCFHERLANVDDPFRSRDGETLFLWHIPKSGRSTIQNLYRCMGATVANEVGMRFDMPTSFFSAFTPYKGIQGKVINVDLHSHEGIMDAKNRGFLTQPDDIPGTNPYPTFITTPEFKFAAENLFSDKHKVRIFIEYDRCNLIQYCLTQTNNHLIICSKL